MLNGSAKQVDNKLADYGVQIQNIKNDMNQSQNNMIVQMRHLDNGLKNDMIKYTDRLIDDIKNDMIKQQNDIMRRKNYLYFPEDAIVYDNIFNALSYC
jgi:hypothetical protein